MLLVITGSLRSWIILTHRLTDHKDGETKDSFFNLLRNLKMHFCSEKAMVSLKSIYTLWIPEFSIM